MALSQFDIVKGLDFTALANATAADHNALVDSAAPILDSASEGKGLVIWTVDSALNTPVVPNAAGTTKWKRYIWLRIPHASAANLTPLWYAWTDSTASIATYLKWLRVTADTTAVEALIAALDLRVDAAEADIVVALATANSANSNASNAVNTANAAQVSANTALTNANDALALATSASATATTATATATAANALATTANTTANNAAASLATVVTNTTWQTSAQYALTATGLIATIAHGFGVVPKHVKWVMVCTIVDLGYAVGDEVDVESSTFAGSNMTFTTRRNATSLRLSMDTLFAVIGRDDTGVRAIINHNNWQAKCYYAKE